jgi:benzylsuccinate CoA-transferase BbsF subunit
MAAHVAASSADFVRDEQLLARHHVVRLPSRVHGTTSVEGPRWLLSRTPGGPARPAPSLGQDNEFVLREFAGVDPDEFARLEEEGVLR